jgi:lysophospholipase L1-like esterase
LRNKNKDSIIVVTGLYNPFETITSKSTNQMLTIWNANTELLVKSFSNAVFVPTYDTFKNKLAEYLAPDWFHPNSKGYAAVADAIFGYIEGTLSTGQARQDSGQSP